MAGGSGPGGGKGEYELTWPQVIISLIVFIAVISVIGGLGVYLLR
jgi:hypothetical protein